VQAKSGQRAKSAGGGAFDIHVVAFAGAPARSLQGLQRIFGVDATAAQRILDGVPGVLRRAAPPDEAEGYREALESIGAQVVLERVAPEEPALPAGRRVAPPPTPAAALRAGGPPPPPAASMGRGEPLRAARNLMDLSEPPLPRPVLRPPSEDLEFDMLATDEPEYGSDPLRGFGEPQQAIDDADPDEPHEPAEATRKGMRTMRREELELDSGDSGGALDLALPTRSLGREPAGSQRREPTSRGEDAPALETEVTRAPSEAQASRTQRTAGPKTETSAAQRGPVMSRAAVVEKRGVAQTQAPRSLALMQLLAAVLVVGLGVRFDSSVVYGNASPFSVVVHGLAIQQFVLGVWGLFR
jgi:hypothetical protein